MGRSSMYTPALATTICERLANTESLRSICQDPAMPSRTTVMQWLRNGTHPHFANEYAWARQFGLDAMADEILAIADQPLPILHDGRIDPARVQQQRLQIGARKWIMSKQLAKKYGATASLPHTGRPSLTVVTGVPHRDDSPSEE